MREVREGVNFEQQRRRGQQSVQPAGAYTGKLKIQVPGTALVG